MRWRIDGTWKWVAALLGLTLVAFETTNLDLWLQDGFFDFATGTWLIPRREAWTRALFYTGPKVLIILGGLGVLVLLLGPIGWRERWGVNRKQLGVVFLTLAIVPSFIGFLKGATGVYCPWDIRRYGGPAPYVKVFERHPIDDRPDYAGGGFPAGHASGGFALVALMTLARTRRQQAMALGLALTMGWVMGLYQMAKGAHYLSHTLVTMWLAWLIYLGIARLIDADNKPARPEPKPTP